MSVSDWLANAAIIPDERTLERAARGVETYFDKRCANEPELRRYRGFRDSDHGQAGNCAGQIGQKLAQDERWGDASKWHAADVAHQLMERERPRKHRGKDDPNNEYRTNLCIALDHYVIRCKS